MNEGSMKKIEPYKEKPERIPDEKVEIVFHQGKRLGPCFGEHSVFSFDSETVTRETRYYDSSSAGFYNDAVSKVVQRMAKDLDEKIRREYFRGVDPNNPLK